MVKMMIAKDDRPYLSCFLEVGEDNGGRCLASRTGHGTRDGGLQKGFYNTGHDCNHTRNTSIGFVKDNPSDRWISRMLFPRILPLFRILGQINKVQGEGSDNLTCASGGKANLGILTADNFYNFHDHLITVFVNVEY